jgi:hypothetical protein
VLNGLNGFVQTVATKDVLPAMERRVASLNAVVTRYVQFSKVYSILHVNALSSTTRHAFALKYHWCKQQSALSCAANAHK